MSSVDDEGVRCEGPLEAEANEHAREVEITSKRLGELIRWHGTDETALPPAHTLHHLSRDTVAALRELAHAREQIAQLRAAIGRAFWAVSRTELNAILLGALGPPPEESRATPDPPCPPESGPTAGVEDTPAERASPTRLDAGISRAVHHAGAARPLSSRAS